MDAYMHVEPGFTYNAIVSSIYDGDTARLDIDLGFKTWMKAVACRLEGINAPEVRGSEKVAGKASRDFLRQLIPVGTEVVIISRKKGKYGRWIVSIMFVEDTEDGPIQHCANDVLVLEGHAVYKQY